MSDPTSYVRNVEKDLDSASSPSKEARNPAPVVAPDGTVLGRERAYASPAGARGTPAGLRSQYPREEEKQLWNHVKHLETQLEFLTSSHQMPQQGGYNTELTQTLKHLAENEGDDAERAPSMVATSSNVAVPDMSATPEAAEDKKLWNAWDLRLNIGLEVGKWFGHEMQQSQYNEEPAYDVGNDPNKNAAGSLPYAEVMEVNKRMKTISTLEELTDKLDACRSDWQDRLAVLQSAVKRSLKASAATHRTPDSSLQEHLGTEVKDLNRRFLVEVDTLLHQIGFTSDIWGDLAKKEAHIAALEEHNKELASRLNHEVNMHSEARDTLEHVHTEKKAHEHKLGTLEEAHGNEQRSRMEVEYKNQWLEQQLQETQEALKKSEVELQDVQAKLAKEEKLHGRSKTDYGDLVVRDKENSVQVEALKRQLQKEEKLRTQVAKECADVHIELTHTLEDLEMERHNAAKLVKENERSQKEIEELKANREANDMTAKHTVEMVELKLKLEEQNKLQSMLEEEKEEAEAHADSLALQLQDVSSKLRAEEGAHKAAVRDLKLAVSDLTKKNGDLQRSNDLVFQELDELQNNREADAAIAELRAALDETLEARDAHARKHDDLRVQHGQLAKELEEHKGLHSEHKVVAEEALNAEKQTRQSLLHDIEIYKQEVENLRTKLEDEIAQRGKDSGTISEQNSNLEEQKQLLAVLRAEKSVLKTELAEYEKDLEKEVHDHAMTKEQVALAQHEVATWKAKYEHELINIQALEEARGVMSETESELEKRLSAMAIEHAQDMHTIDELKKQLHQARLAKEEATKDRDDAIERLERLHEQVEEVTHDRNAMEAINGELKREIALQQFERARMADKLEETNQMVNNVQQVIDRLTATKEEQDAELHQLRARCSQEQKEKAEVGVKSGALQREVLFLKDSLDDAKAQLESNKRELQRVNKLLDAERIEKDSFSSTLGNTKQNFKDLMKEHQDASEEKSKIEQDLHHCRKKMQELIAEKADLARQLDDMAVELEEKRKEYEELNMKHEFTQEELDKCHESLKNGAQSHADFEMKKMALDQELLDSQFRLESADRKEEQLLTEWRMEKNRYEEELLQLDLHDKEAKAMLQADIVQLQNSMTEAITTSQQKYHAYEEEIAHYKRQVHAGLVREEELSKDQERLISELEAANGRLAEEALARQKLEGHNDSLESKLVKLEAQNAAILEELDDMQTEAGDLERLKAKLLGESDNMKKRIEEARDQLAESEENASDLRRKLRAQEQEFQDTKNEKTSADLELQRVEKKMEAERTSRQGIEKELEEVKLKLQEAEKDLSRASVESSARSTECESYKEKVREVLQQKSEIMIEKERVETELDRLRRELGSPGAGSRDLTTLKGSMEKDLKDFRAKLGIY